MADRLRTATSPYLLQHAGNPVDWWPWGDEAFAAARERDVPVLLSVGYSACHWCHVMAHETFEDPGTAALMNEHLVSIKVDREERPDVDAVYMAATQAMTGQGGWPMTAFLTPGREPFFCGTYFPTEQFRNLVAAISHAWTQERGAVNERAERIAAALARQMDGWTGGTSVSSGQQAAGQMGAGRGLPADALAAACDQAVSALESGYDPAGGGFGGAPKFPPSMVLEFLLRYHERTAPSPAPAMTPAPAGPQRPAESPGTAASAGPALRLAEGTLRAMAGGGMYDQLAGGFARYSVDARWVVPHFEKMLYDNALLARVYAHWWRRTGSDLGRRVAAETCAWMIAGLRTAEGGFASALDADSDGEEGAYYVWTPAQLADVLGAQDGQYAASELGVTADGTFEDGKSVLQRRRDPQDPARLERVRAALLAARQRRVPPSRDDKVVAAWNGLAIAALAETGLLLQQPEFTQAALAAAELLARTHLDRGRLVRTSREGVAGATAGVLEDYGCVAEGFLSLAGVTGQERWAGIAGDLLATALDRFGRADGGFYDTADDSEQLIYRPAEPTDGPSPSGTFAVAGALLSYSALTGSQRHREAAAAALRPLAAIAGRYPRAAGWGLAVAEAMLSGPAEIAIVGPPGDSATAELHRTALLAAPPGAVVAIGTGTGDGADAIGLLAGRGLIGGAPAAYVCRGFTCQLPVTDPQQLRAQLAATSPAPAAGL